MSLSFFVQKRKSSAEQKICSQISWSGLIFSPVGKHPRLFSDSQTVVANIILLHARSIYCICRMGYRIYRKSCMWYRICRISRMRQMRYHICHIDTDGSPQQQQSAVGICTPHATEGQPFLPARPPAAAIAEGNLLATTSNNLACLRGGKKSFLNEVRCVAAVQPRTWPWTSQTPPSSPAVATAGSRIGPPNAVGICQPGGGPSSIWQRGRQGHFIPHAPINDYFFSSFVKMLFRAKNMGLSMNATSSHVPTAKSEFGCQK